ncbi:unnamed protein product [Parnassius apollo]|uniref:(apollo) hypothetical protein n=1 Tax=Parnassius apollo TaxID=110799 RepID=A0A8S3XGL8_PARAO|nr:unnamed protein product [Parnassius apollo]
MFRPEIYPNQRTRHWPQHFNPRGQFLRRNAVVNRFWPPVSSNPQINYQFWCETCDKGFQTLQLLNNHKLQHEKCNIDGCQFVAHPKIITKHIQMQHSTGLYEKIAKLNNPEEIQKWREERKRKYPTKQNQEKKAAEIKEKVERGEKMGLMKLREINKQQKSDVYNKGKSNYRNNKIRPRQNNKFKNEQSHKPLSKRVCKVMPLITEKCKLQPFTGIQQIVMDEIINIEDDELQQDLLIEDDELTNNASDFTSQVEPLVCGALSSLMCNYGSSDEEVTQDHNIIHKKSTDDSINSKQLYNEHEKSQEKINDKPLLLNSTDNKSDNDSGPEEIVIKKTATEENNIEEEGSKHVKLKTTDKRVINNRSNIKVIRKPKYHLPSTLLVKLLSREIEQERNIILQCIRYVVKNNFFDNL